MGVDGQQLWDRLLCKRGLEFENFAQNWSWCNKKKDLSTITDPKQTNIKQNKPQTDNHQT